MCRNSNFNPKSLKNFLPSYIRLNAKKFRFLAVSISYYCWPVLVLIWQRRIVGVATQVFHISPFLCILETWRFCLIICIVLFWKKIRHDLFVYRLKVYIYFINNNNNYKASSHKSSSNFLTALGHQYHSNQLNKNYGSILPSQHNQYWHEA